MRLHQAKNPLLRDAGVMEIRFPGGLEVEAVHEGFTILTDQPVAQGGAGAAPSPFDLFLASIGTCAGLYALTFCRQRNLDTEGLAVSLIQKKDGDGKRVAGIRIEITLPPEFPARYREAILRAVDQCKVKRHILEAPRFEVIAVASKGPPAPEPALFPEPPTTTFYQ